MIGSRIRELRREKMWQQRDLANAIGMSAHTISLWETGRMGPSDNAIKEMAKLFGVPVEYLTSDGAGKSKDGSEEATALLKVAENEINQLKDEKEKLMNEIAWYKNEIEWYANELTAVKADRQKIRDELKAEREKPTADADLEAAREEVARLKDTIVHLAMKGALN